MAETVLIKDVTVKGTSKKTGKDYYLVTLEDGRVGTCFDDVRGSIGQEIDFDIKESSYQGKKQFVFYLPKEEKEQKSAVGVKSNPTADLKKFALQMACTFTADEPDIEHTLSVAEKFFEFLKS
jgi:hypothetical protein